MIELKIDPEFRDKIPPLTDEEFKQLEENILSDGEVYEPICVWNGVIVDGHNRYNIVQEHPEIPFKVKDMEFADKWEAFEWMYRKQLGRRNLTEAQKAYMVGKMYEARKNTESFKGNQYTSGGGQNVQNQTRREIKDGTAGQIGKEFDMTSRTVRRNEKFAKGLDALKEVSPEAADKILKGEVDVSKEEVSELREQTEKERKTFADKVLNPVPKEKKPKPYKNPNIAPIKKNRTRFTSEEEKKIADRVNRIVEIQNDNNRDTSITIDDLAELVEEDGKDYVSSLRNMLVVRSTLLVGENRQVIADVLENIINEINKVKELLK